MGSVDLKDLTTEAVSHAIYQSDLMEKEAFLTMKPADAMVCIAARVTAHLAQILSKCITPVRFE